MGTSQELLSIDEKQHRGGSSPAPPSTASTKTPYVYSLAPVLARRRPSVHDAGYDAAVSVSWWRSLLTSFRLSSSLPPSASSSSSKAKPFLHIVTALGVVLSLLALCSHLSFPLLPFSSSSSSSASPPLSLSSRPLTSDAGIATIFLTATLAHLLAFLLSLPAAAMVRLADGSVAARALVFMSTHPLSPQITNKAQYAANTATAVTALQKWYDAADGLWNTTGWWNSANLVTTLADFAVDGASDADKATLEGVFANTFTNAQLVAQTAVKVVDESFLVTSSYTRTTPASFNFTSRDDGGGAGAAPLAARDGFAGFINEFYDDEGWWALAWIRAFDVTGRADYLAMAESIFADMQGGTQPASCGGGIWWSKDDTYKNAIANELYLAVAASLANRAEDATSKASYLKIAAAQWAWFKGSGMINSAGTINDGLTIRADGSCVNNNQTVWSYNQGVVLGGLVELHRAQGGSDATLIPAAAAIANAAIDALSRGGILHESCEANNGTCGGDGPTFKGVFLRNLHYLQQEPTLDASTARALKAYVLQNADSIWAADRVAGTNQLGLVWSGPATAGGAPTAATHGAAMDCLVAAVAAA